jgi:transposase
MKQGFDLQTLYRSLELLEDNWEKVEKELYEIAVNTYQQTHTELFYDSTSSYLEGHQCTIATYGYSRDKRQDKVQIVIGLVTTYDGFPVQCKMYPGNTKDETTVSSVIEELTHQYKIKEIVFVGDRGMLTAKSVESIQKQNQKYVMAIPRHWSKKYLQKTVIHEDYMEEVGNHLYAASIDSIDSNTNERLLLCLNTQKRDDDHAYRRHCMETIQTELDKLKERVNQPSKHTKVLSRDEVMKKAGSILKDTPAGKYFHVYTQTGTREDASSKNKTHQTTSNKTLRESFQFYYEIKEFLVEEDSRLDGTFLIQTNQRNYTKKRLIEIYKHLLPLNG